MVLLLDSRKNMLRKFLRRIRVGLTIFESEGLKAIMESDDGMATWASSNGLNKLSGLCGGGLFGDGMYGKGVGWEWVMVPLLRREGTHTGMIDSLLQSTRSSTVGGSGRASKLRLESLLLKRWLSSDFEEAREREEFPLLKHLNPLSERFTLMPTQRMTKYEEIERIGWFDGWHALDQKTISTGLSRNFLLSTT